MGLKCTRKHLVYSPILEQEIMEMGFGFTKSIVQVASEKSVLGTHDILKTITSLWRSRSDRR
jgi:hypothetical protein